MFQFDDILLIDDRAIQMVLRETDQKDCVLALKGANDGVKNKILKNMSARARQMVLEDMEVMGPVRPAASEEAQQKIVNVIRRLEESGEIVRDGEPGKSNGPEGRDVMPQDETDVKLAQPPAWNEQDLSNALAKISTRCRNPAELVQVLVGFASKARRVGLLPLEDDVNAVDEEVLLLGLQLTVDGTDGGLVTSILRNRKKALLAAYETRLEIMILGVESISCGDNPRIVEAKLMALINPPAPVQP